VDGNILANHLGREWKSRRHLPRIRHRQGAARWVGYDNFMANARLGTLPADMHKFSSCSYMRLLVKKGYPFHITPLLRVKQLEARPLHVIAFEGNTADAFNTLNTTLSFECVGRDDAVIADFPDAVAEDMRDVTYSKVTLAHQHKQGGRIGNPPCSMIGHGCTHDYNVKTIQMYQLDGDMYIGYDVSAASFNSFRKNHSMLEWPELIDQWREAWRYRGVTGYYVPILKDVACETCLAEPQDKMGRAIWGENEGHILCASCWAAWCRHFRPKLRDDMTQSELDDLWIDFNAWITERNAPEAEDPECICSTAEHPTLATENVPSNFKWKKDHYKLCLPCQQTWNTYITPSAQPHAIRWQNKPWSDEYPKLCDDCARAWDIIMKARGQASRDVESSRKFIKKHPMKNVEEYFDSTTET